MASKREPSAVEKAAESLSVRRMKAREKYVRVVGCAPEKAERKADRLTERVEQDLDWLVTYWTLRRDDPACEVMGGCACKSCTLMRALRRAVLAARKAKPTSKPVPSADDAFIRHIQGHLHAGQRVICKICGKTPAEIRAAARKARGKKGKVKP